MTRKILCALIVCAAIYGGVSSAAYISTSSWGTNTCETAIWGSTNLQTTISLEHTPGSDGFKYLRLIKPAYYAWLDGYDTRAFATYDAYPTEAPTAYFRLLYFDSHTNTTFGTFVTRRADLRNGKITPYGSVPPRQVAWSGDIVESCPAYYFEGPAYADFNFTKTPLGLIYLNDGSAFHESTQFCFCFNQLDQSEFFPMGNTVRVANPFQTMLSSNAFGLECYKNDQQIYDFFSKTDVNRCTFSHTTFDDIISYAFFPLGNYESITNKSHRLLVPTLASADQALSLFSRSYKNESPCTHFTKSVYGSAQTGFEAEGTITCDITFDYANNTATIDDCSASFESPTITTNAIVKTDIAYQKAAPCAAYVNVMAPGGNTGAFVDLSGIAPGESMVVAFDDLADVLETIFIDEGASTIIFDMYATYDEFWKNVRIDLRKRGTSDLYRSSWRGYFTGTETVSSAPIKAFANYSYLYETSTDPNFLAARQQYPNNEHWLDCVLKESWYMFSSFCYSTNAPYFYMSGNLRDHLRANDKEADDYGFKCLRKTAVGSSFHNDLMAYYKDELQALCDKCYTYTGHAFHQDPAAYMQLTAGKIDSIFNGDAEFEARISVDTLNTDDFGGVPITRVSPGHYVRGSELGIVAAYTNPSISCSFKESASLPRERHVETYMGIVTEIDWQFPQLILTP